MLSRLSSVFGSLGFAFDSMKKGAQSACSFAGNTFNTVRSPRDAIDALSNGQRRSIFSVITLQMPEVESAHGCCAERQPQYERGMTTSGMFGVQFWPKQEDLALDDPLSTFQAFSQFSQMDETPMTASFQQEVRARAVSAGMLDFDPLANYNHAGLASEVVAVSRPALSKVTRVVPIYAPTAHSGAFAPAARTADRSLADSWLMGRDSLGQAAQSFRSRALDAAAV